MVGCTRAEDTISILRQLESLDRTPLATMVTQTIDTTGYASLLSGGFWQGAYVIGQSAWLL